MVQVQTYPKFSSRQRFFNIVHYLLHLSSGAAKQLNVALAQDLLVLFQSILSVFFTGEKHKGVTSGPSIRVFDEEQALGAVCDRALWTDEGQHFLGCGGKRQATHADNHLVLLGQELGHLIRCTWYSARTVNLQIQRIPDQTPES